MNPSFAVEKTLGKLAKWLRILGFDTIYEQGVSAEEFEDEKKNRVLLTRTRRTWNIYGPESCMLITADRLFEQVQQVMRALAINFNKIQPFTRCIRCNAPIRPIDKNSVYGMIPDYIWETHETFQHCEKCNQTYWAGSHVTQAMEKIRQVFEENDPSL